EPGAALGRCLVEATVRGCDSRHKSDSMETEPATRLFPVFKMTLNWHYDSNTEPRRVPEKDRHIALGRREYGLDVGELRARRPLTFTKSRR
ncbi:hypothetical protein, partial [Rhodococcus sp. NPDC057529]|uniref:hypothetical protein n=1 Tax=Rhodococcus sp. NPDC057529 TaxID=3346158 RepID=UPI00366A6A2B